MVGLGLRTLSKRHSSTVAARQSSGCGLAMAPPARSGVVRSFSPSQQLHRPLQRGMATGRGGAGYRFPYPVLGGQRQRWAASAASAVAGAAAAAAVAAVAMSQLVGARSPAEAAERKWRTYSKGEIDDLVGAGRIAVAYRGGVCKEPATVPPCAWLRCLRAHSDGSCA